jgi:hypothetical protein
LGRGGRGTAGHRGPNQSGPPRARRRGSPRATSGTPGRPSTWPAAPRSSGSRARAAGPPRGSLPDTYGFYMPSENRGHAAALAPRNGASNRAPPNQAPRAPGVRDGEIRVKPRTRDRRGWSRRPDSNRDLLIPSPPRRVRLGADVFDRAGLCSSCPSAGIQGVPARERGLAHRAAGRGSSGELLVPDGPEPGHEGVDQPACVPSRFARQSDFRDPPIEIRRQMRITRRRSMCRESKPPIRSAMRRSRWPATAWTSSQ